MKRALLAMLFCVANAYALAQSVTPGISPATPGAPGVVLLAHPGYLVGNWYGPDAGWGIATAGWVNPGTGEMVCSFGYVAQQITINNLAVNVSTLSAGGNLQLAIYANGAWGRPSVPIITTSSVSTNATGPIGVAVSTQFGPGGYWFCDNFDNSIAAVVAYSLTMSPMTARLGSSSASSVLALTAVTGVKIAQSFGTWPTFTSGTAWVDATTAISPAIVFKIASVP